MTLTTTTTTTTTTPVGQPDAAQWSARTCFVPVSLDVSRRWFRLPRSVRRLVRQLHCQRGLPVMIGDAALPPGSRVAVVAGGRFSRKDLSTVVAIAAERGWNLEVIGAAMTGAAASNGPPLPHPDVLDSAAAAGVSRSIEEATGRRPAWDVVHGPSLGAALRQYVAGDDRPAALVVPHQNHGDHGKCSSITVAGQVGVPVLLL